MNGLWKHWVNRSEGSMTSRIGENKNFTLKNEEEPDSSPCWQPDKGQNGSTSFMLLGIQHRAFHRGPWAPAIALVSSRDRTGAYFLYFQLPLPRFQLPHFSCTSSEKQLFAGSALDPWLLYESLTGLLLFSKSLLNNIYSFKPKGNYAVQAAVVYLCQGGGTNVYLAIRNHNSFNVF